MASTEPQHIEAGSVAGDERKYTVWKWRILLATMMCYLFYYCGRFNLAIALKPIADEFGWDNSTVYRLVSLLILTYGIGQFINGNLGDRFGRVLMPIGAIVSCVCNWIFSFSSSIGNGLFSVLHVSSAAALIFGTMSVAWAVNGYFQAMGMAPGGRLISNWWVKKERGRAMGFYTFAASMSTVTVFLLAAWVAEGMGWRWVFRIPPLLMASVACVFYVVTRDHPEDVGLRSREVAGGGKHGGSLAQYAVALKNGSFMLACLSLAFHHVSRWGLLSMLPKFFGDVADWNPKKAGFTVAALPVGMALGALSGGVVSDKLFHGKRARVILISLVLCAVCTVLIPRFAGVTPEIGKQAAEMKVTQEEREGPLVDISQSKRNVIVLMLLVSGFFLYVCIAPYFALCPDLLGVKNAGTGIGIMDAIAYGGAAAGTYTMGKMIDAQGYNSAFLFMAVCSIVGAVLIVFLREGD